MSPRPSFRPRRRFGCMSVVGYLLIVGVVLGAWRYLGRGIGIGSPGWLTAATSTMGHMISHLGSWVGHLVGWLKPKIRPIHLPNLHTTHQPQPAPTPSASGAHGAKGGR